MQKMKHLKNDYVQLGNLIYKPYTVCSLPPTFGATDENGYSGFSTHQENPLQYAKDRMSEGFDGLRDLSKYELIIKK